MLGAICWYQTIASDTQPPSLWLESKPPRQCQRRALLFTWQYKLSLMTMPVTCRAASELRASAEVTLSLWPAVKLPCASSESNTLAAWARQRPILLHAIIDMMMGWNLDIMGSKGSVAPVWGLGTCSGNHESSHDDAAAAVPVQHHSLAAWVSHHDDSRWFRIYKTCVLTS